MQKHTVKKHFKDFVKISITHGYVNSSLSIVCAWLCVTQVSCGRITNENEVVREGVALVVTLMPDANLKKVREKGARKAVCARKKEKGASHTHSTSAGPVRRERDNRSKHGDSFSNLRCYVFSCFSLAFPILG